MNFFIIIIERNTLLNTYSLHHIDSLTEINSLTQRFMTDKRKNHYI